MSKHLIQPYSFLSIQNLIKPELYISIFNPDKNRIQETGPDGGNNLSVSKMALTSKDQMSTQ